VTARLVWAALHARRARLLLALLAITLGVAVSIALTALALQVGDDFARTLRAAGPNFVVMPAGARWPLDLGGAEVEPPRAGAAIDPGSLAGLKRTFWRNNVLEIAPELDATLRVEGKPVVVFGTWFDRTIPIADGTWRTGLARLRQAWQVEGRWPAEEADEIALGRTLATTIGARIGSALEVSGPGGHRAFRVTGIVDADPGVASRAWAPLERVAELSSRPHEADRVWLSALVLPPARKPPPDPKHDPVGYERHLCTAYPDVVARDLSGAIPGAEVLARTEVVAGEGAVVRRLNLLMILLALAALTASVLGLLATSTATVVERRTELALLRALGAGPRQVSVLLLGETLLVAIAGGFAGWTLGVVAARLIRGDTFGTEFSPTPLLLPLAVALAFAVSAIGTLGPLRMALRLDAAQVLRG
jgi:putative ABC transport system permease protein